MRETISVSENRLHILKDHFIKKEEQERIQLEEARRRARELQEKENMEGNKKTGKSLLKRPKPAAAPRGSVSKERDSKSIKSGTSVGKSAKSVTSSP